MPSPTTIFFAAGAGGRRHPGSGRATSSPATPAPCPIRRGRGRCGECQSALSAASVTSATIAGHAVPVGCFRLVWNRRRPDGGRSRPREARYVSTRCAARHRGRRPRSASPPRSALRHRDRKAPRRSPGTRRRRTAPARPHRPRPRRTSITILLVAAGVAMDENPAIVTIADGEARLAIVVGGAAGEPGPSGPAAAEGPGKGLGVHDACSPSPVYSNEAERAGGDTAM